VLDACAAPGMKTSQLAGKYFTEKNIGSVPDPILYFTHLD
jgi:16S rRNA C967 or C1407 C5-methylase (RsmB/RsmF family)